MCVSCMRACPRYAWYVFSSCVCACVYVCMLEHGLFRGRFAVHRLGLASAGTGFTSETIRVSVCVLLPLYICQDDICRMRPLSGKAENRRRQCFVGVFTNDDAPMIMLVSRLYLVLGLASRLLSSKWSNSETADRRLRESVFFFL